jgi:hypothetical protein
MRLPIRCKSRATVYAIGVKFRGPGGPRSYRPRAPTDPDLRALPHPVPQIMVSLRTHRLNAKCVREPTETVGGCDNTRPTSPIVNGCGGTSVALVSSLLGGRVHCRGIILVSAAPPIISAYLALDSGEPYRPNQTLLPLSQRYALSCRSFSLDREYFGGRGESSRPRGL